eukprot:scaffold143690_cov76-Cyclotella_meneghiniana.AAC.1
MENFFRFDRSIQTRGVPRLTPIKPTVLLHPNGLPVHQTLSCTSNAPLTRLPNNILWCVVYCLRLHQASRIIAALIFHWLDVARCYGVSDRPERRRGGGHSSSGGADVVV